MVTLDDPQVAGAELKGARIIECDGRTANPFLTPPRACTFNRDGQTVVLSLNWQRISRSELLQHHWHRAHGESGFGVRSSGPGYWVEIQELGPEAQAVLARALYGKPHVDVILGPDDTDAGVCQDVYRASADNIKAMSAEAEIFRKQGNPHAADEYVKALEKMRAAVAAGRALTGPVTCPLRKAAGRSAPPSLARGRIFILTDSACFSSCIRE